MLGLLLMTLFLFVILLAICSAVMYKMKTMNPGGRCQRLCCQFRHREMRWELSEAAPGSSLEVLGVQRSHVESIGTTMEELERINKEIESVKAEVAEKRKRLSRFTLALEELSQSPVASLSDTIVRQGFPENSLLPKEQWNEPSKSKESQPRKYVMDHRCPATDLEYDPLLNYSAGLLGASKPKQGETDRQHFWKKSVGGNCHKCLESQRPYVSPIRIKINLQDSDEDDLVMDVPPIIPTSKKSKPFRGFKYQNMDEKIQVSPLEERNLQISGIEEEKIDETQLTAQTGDDSNKFEPPKSHLKTSLDTKTNINLWGVKDHISKMESFGGEEKHVCISGGSITCAPLSDKEIQKESHNESYPKSRRHVNTIDDTQKEETEWRYSPSQLQFSYSDNHVKDKVLRVQDDSQDFTTFEDNRLVEFDFGKECTEDDTPSEADDTVKECLQIFNKFTRSKARKGETAKQPSGKQMELDMQYYQNISGPKRRIAHTAKFDVPTSKEITSPSRGPVPPLISHTGILQAQQQAVQIMAAIKGGQAFVAATSEQKKNTFACPASQTQRKASGENSCTSDSLHEDVVLSKENPTAKPNRSHIPVKSIASFPVKAKIEEKTIYECCGRRNMYVNIARNTLKKLRDQASRRMCCRCGKIYGVTPAGKHSSVEECHYHFGRLRYTAKGLELTQVTVVDPSLQVGYDTSVKPDEEVIDYNTRFSGVVEDDLKDTKTSIRDVQATMLNMFSTDTVLIGHSFECSLYALKLIHTSAVDTTVMFPHWLGSPHKRSLKSLVADYLWRIIQDDGHNSSENATACMELWKVKDDLKGKK
ncbi:uncharacterized protein LOC101276190 [Orcinus orca]|uniref:uncharacterized protein LOC101276190 n=1 Tax=Orcinus orca TaxID=9733 RepID=UPI0021119278|nr:uncharacterized protein LOC101276190 [Orcinus orca]